MFHQMTSQLMRAQQTLCEAASTLRIAEVRSLFTNTSSAVPTNYRMCVSATLSARDDSRT